VITPNAYIQKFITDDRRRSLLAEAAKERRAASVAVRPTVEPIDTVGLTDSMRGRRMPVAKRSLVADVSGHSATPAPKVALAASSCQGSCEHAVAA
jgi:hypothetical protein